MTPPDPRLAPELLGREPRARGIGLRGQIMLALVTGLGLAVALVGIAIDRLATRAIELERERSAEVAARAAASAIGRADAPPIVIDRVEGALLRADGVIGLAIVGPDGVTIEVRGERHGVMGEAPIAGGRVRTWVSSGRGLAGDGLEGDGLEGDGLEGDGASAALVRIVVLYAAITSLGILVLCYVLLTRLIVRPVEELTLASERLARGRGDARARVHGAAEVQQLAITFNAMADDLRTERASLEARLRELEQRTRELRSAQDVVVRSEKLASVGRLAAGVAHEIGNPLAAILGLLELVRDEDLDPAERTELLARIQSETERISRIIRELLAYAHESGTSEGAGLEAGDLRADLGAVVERAVHLVAPQKDLRRITIERRIPEDLPSVRGDADRLAQVVLNLLLNAADAIEGEGTIEIAIEEDGDGVVLSVSDTGPGIAPGVRDRIFEPFVTTKKAGEGTGLGLAVCWTIVDRLGGTIRAEPAPSGGARFAVRLPIAR